MKIVQVTMTLTLDELAGIRNGSLFLYGCVTNATSGRVVRWPKVVKYRIGDTISNIASSVKQYCSDHKTQVIVAGIGVVVVVGVGVGVDIRNYLVRTKLTKKFEFAFFQYLQDIERGNLSIDHLNSLIVVSNELTKKYENHKLRFTAKEIIVLLDKLSDYTIRLAEANNYQISSNELRINDERSINALQTLLRIQKNIFKKVA